MPRMLQSFFFGTTKINGAWREIWNNHQALFARFRFYRPPFQARVDTHVPTMHHERHQLTHAQSLSPCTSGKRKNVAARRMPGSGSTTTLLVLCRARFAGFFCFPWTCAAGLLCRWRATNSHLLYRTVRAKHFAASSDFASSSDFWTQVCVVVVWRYEYRTSVVKCG